MRKATGKNRCLNLLFIAIGLSLSVLFGGTGFSADQEDEVVALLNGEPIYRSEVEQPVAFQIYRLRGNIYTILKRQTEELVTQKLLEKEASAQGLSLDELLRKEIDEKTPPPSDTEIEAYLATHPSSTLDEETQRNRAKIFLHQNALSKRKREFIASIQDKADFKLVMQPPEKPRSKVPIQGQPWRGNPDAPIVLVHFSNFTCKLCDRSTEYILRANRDFPGKIKWVHRNYFNRVDENDLKLAQLSEWTFEQNRFWEFHDAVFNESNDRRTRNIDGIVKQIGLDSSEFGKKEQDGHYLLKVKSDLTDARRIGVTSVPVMFVNGIYFSSTFPYEQLQKLIQKELAAEKNL